MSEDPDITTDARIGVPRISAAVFAGTRRGRRIKPVVLGQDGSRWKDIYHFILTVPWSVFFLAMALVYLAINTIFAGLYLLSPHGILHEHPNSFLDAFFFSVQTFGSIGYGVLAPSSLYVNAFVTIESFLSLMYAAIATGLLFARFSRPFARIIFSDVAVIAPFDGVPTLMFRAANQRANLMLDATATVSLARQVTNKGDRDRLELHPLLDLAPLLVEPGELRAERERRAASSASRQAMPMLMSVSRPAAFRRGATTYPRSLAVS